MVKLANTSLSSLDELGKAFDDPRLQVLNATGIGTMHEYIGSMDALFKPWEKRLS